VIFNKQVFWGTVFLMRQSSTLMIILSSPCYNKSKGCDIKHDFYDHRKCGKWICFFRCINIFRSSLHSKLYFIQPNLPCILFPVLFDLPWILIRSAKDWRSSNSSRKYFSQGKGYKLTELTSPWNMSSRYLDFRRNELLQNNKLRNYWQVEGSYSEFYL